MNTPLQTQRTVLELVSEWTSASVNSSNSFSITRDLIEFLDQQLYSQFQPDANKPLFMNRLASWLANVDSTEERQCLFNFVPWLLFVGLQELESMYVAAFQGPIARWIINESRIDITLPDFQQRFRSAVNRTFFGSIAGMDLGAFLRINGIQGQSIRPDFRQLSRIGNRESLLVETGIYDRVVAVEDVVGTGTQLLDSVPSLAWLSPKPVLFCPFIMATNARELYQQSILPDQNNSHMSLSPLFVVPANATMPEFLPQDHPELLRRIHQIAVKYNDKVCGSNPDGQHYGPFGYGRIGSLVVTYLNCPDNVPPFVHYSSETWNPLFPRNSREGM